MGGGGGVPGSIFPGYCNDYLGCSKGRERLTYFYNPEPSIVSSDYDTLNGNAHLLAEIANGDEKVKADAIRIGNYTDGQFPTDSREFAKRIFYTVFMGSENRLVHVQNRMVLIASSALVEIVLTLQF